MNNPYVDMQITCFVNNILTYILNIAQVLAVTQCALQTQLCARFALHANNPHCFCVRGQDVHEPHI